MTWEIVITGHNGTEEYGSDEYKATEAELADKGDEFARSLKSKGAVTARFVGNFVNRATSLRPRELETP